MPSETEQRGIEQLANNILDIKLPGQFMGDVKKQAQVKEYEKQIDQMVYKLYGLTKEEIKIVEGGNK